MKAGMMVLAAVSLGLNVLAGPDQRITSPLSVPMRITGTVEMADCDNSHGPQVTLKGSLVLGGVNAQVIFRNNVKGTHEHIEQFTANGVLLPEGASITIPKQPVLGGTGGNPFIWIQFYDANDNALTDEIFLGRCVQGLSAVDASVLEDAFATLTVHTDCANSPGPFITLSGDMALSGLNARFIFRNNDNPVGGPHKAERAVDVSLIPDGFSIRFPKQPVLGGVGGNPWMWVQLTDPDGEPTSEEYLIGRCVQTSK